MNVEQMVDIFKVRLNEIRIMSLLKFNILFIVVHCCCILRKILFASKGWTLDQTLVDFYFPPINRQQQFTV